MIKPQIVTHKNKKSVEIGKPCRNMLLVLNNPDPGFTELWLKGLYEFTQANYVCGQLERGEQGTLHIQAFINFKQVSRFSKVHKYDKRVSCHEVLINNGAHDYCMKTETRVEGPWEFGIKPVQRNNKTDWNRVFDLAKQSKFDEIPADIVVKHYGNLQRIAKDSIQFLDKNALRGIWIYGPAGCGKSRLAREICYAKGGTNNDIYPKTRNEWWDGYRDQKYVIMDDMDPYSKSLGGKLKDWTDRYGIVLANKGSGVADNYEYFIVTSQYTIHEIFTDEKKVDTATIEALERRFKQINFLNNGKTELIDRTQPRQWQTTDIDLSIL